MDLQDQIKEIEPWKYYECHKKYSEKQLDMICHQYEIRLAGMRKYQKKNIMKIASTKNIVKNKVRNIINSIKKN